MRIGLVSDTHGFFDPQLPRRLAGVDHLLHAGDIGSPEIIRQLEAIAPVTAVLGNNDDPGWSFRETELVVLGGRRILVHHIVNPQAPSSVLARALKQHAPEWVVFGHTHAPFEEEISGRLYLNPGYAGRPRFNARRTVATLHLDARGHRCEWHVLD